MQDWHLEIEEQGESGERVLMGMNHRLQRTLDEHTAANRMYDWVLLLGGINDLGGECSSRHAVSQAGLVKQLKSRTTLDHANAAAAVRQVLSSPEPHFLQP